MAKKRERSVLDLDDYRAELLEAIAGRLVHADDLKGYLQAWRVLAVGWELLGAEHPAVKQLAAVMPVPRLLVRHHTSGFNQRMIPVPRDCLTVVVPADKRRSEIEVCVNTSGIAVDSAGDQLAAYEFADLLPADNEEREDQDAETDAES